MSPKQLAKLRNHAKHTLTKKAMSQNLHFCFLPLGKSENLAIDSLQIREGKMLMFQEIDL